MGMSYEELSRKKNNSEYWGAAMQAPRASVSTFPVDP